MTKRHSLRPKEGQVLICENLTDSQLVSDVLKYHTSLISVINGQGRETLPVLAELFQPASYLWDRDFKFSVSDAESTYAQSFKKPRLVWTHVDIESYLLHPDWPFRFIQEVSTSKRPLKLKNPPNSEADIEKDLMDFAKKLIPDHAGRRTCEIINQKLKMYRRGQFGVPSKIKNGKEISSETDWEGELQNTANIIKNNLNEGLSSPELSNVLDIYSAQINQYTTYVSSLADIRLHFSGERMLKLLADKWGVPGTSINDAKYKDWQVIRLYLMKYTVEHSKTISGLLSYDDRLADFGHIASKLIGKIV